MAQTSPTSGTASVQTAGAQAGEYLAFKLGAEHYAIDILCVQEIRSYEQPTRMAGAPEFIKGVVNLRGVIVPVIDMRIRFGLAEVTYDHLTVVIVINVGAQVVGMVVDGVSDVVSIAREDLLPAPEFTGSVDSDNVLAIASLQDSMLIVLDIERLLTGQDIGLAKPVTH